MSRDAPRVGVREGGVVSIPRRPGGSAKTLRCEACHSAGASVEAHSSKVNLTLICVSEYVLSVMFPPVGFKAN